MTLLPDSGDPGNEFDKLKLDQQKPELLTEPTWQHLNREYQLRGELGKGGQALVLQVKERKAPHGRRAIKVYHENTDAARRLFEHESRVIASDHLPQDLVVGYYASVNEPGIQPYLVLEFIDGETIAAWSQRRMPMEHRISLWETMLRALHRLHQCHLVFGDLSSKNVMVGRDDTIRFIDLAGAKPVKKAYSASQSSMNLGTPGTMPDAWKDGNARTALWTDIYAASAIGFLILTGKDKASVPPAQWEAELSVSGVPVEVRRIVLKGLREKDTTKTEDPALYPSAEHVAVDISKWREGLVRRERRIRQTLVTTLLLFIVAAIGFVGWQRYYEAIASSDLKFWQSLQAEIRELPNLTHPAVAKLLADEKSLITQRDEADARQDRVASRTATTQLLAKSREVLTVAREIDSAERQRIAIGKLLLEDEATEKSGFWVTQAPAIQTRLTALQQRYRDIAQRVEAGQTAKIATDLAQLQSDLADLFKVSLDARLAFEARIGYERVLSQVPERLQSNDGFLTIKSGAEQAEKSWAQPTWDAGQSLALARQQFGVSTQQLTEWLPRNLNAEEQAALERDSRARVAELTTEAATLRSTIDAQTAKVNELNQQIADLAKAQTDLNKQMAVAKTELTAEQTSRSEADEKVRQLTQTASDRLTQLTEAQAKLKTLQTMLDKVSPDLKKAQADLTAAQQQLATVTQARDTALAEAERVRKLLTDTPGVDLKLSDKLAALQTDIAKLDPKNREAAQTALVQAATEYRQLEAERAELVRPDAYTEKHPKVKAKDAELAQAATALEAALQKRDSADKLAFEALQLQIDAKQKLHDNELEAGVAQQNPDLVTLRNEITKLKESQDAYAEGRQRALVVSPTYTPPVPVPGDGGKTSTASQPLSVQDILKLAAVPALAFGGPLIGTKAGETREITLPGGVKQIYIWCPPTKEPFTMGTPGATDEESPVQVTLTQGFWLAQTETTQAQYTAIMGTSPWVVHGDTDYYYKAGANFPASYIDHTEAEAYCAKLTEIEGKAGRLPTGWKYALPTEAQWQYACRAGTKTKYSFGDDESQLGEYAWFTKNADEIGEKYAHGVGTKKPNPWGLSDMHGNVWEWCRDAYEAKLPGGTDPLVVSSDGAADRVSRGGCWNDSSVHCRSASRGRYLPSGRSIYLGFRPATVPVAPSK